jgi:hypothetical protein
VVYRRGETGILPINAPDPGLARLLFTFLTLEIDLAAAEEARTTYPRYVPE